MGPMADYQMVDIDQQDYNAAASNYRADLGQGRNADGFEVEILYLI